MVFLDQKGLIPDLLSIKMQIKVVPPLHKGEAGPKVKKRLLKNLLQKALYPRCRSKKSPKSPPKSRNNFFEFFLEQEI